jgi:hypothetical protein
MLNSALGSSKVAPIAPHAVTEPPFPRTLNIGCGRKRIDGALNVDISTSVAPDLILDATVRPWPLPDNWFQEVHAYDVVEHIPDVLAFFEELHRVCAHDAVIHITVPHFSSSNAFTDPTHRHYFGVKSFDYFTGEHQHDHYTSVRFRKESVDVVFEPSLLNKAVWRVAQRYTERWEGRWAWMFPAWFISARLRAVKL